MSIENAPNHTFNTKSEFEELRQNSWDKWISAACKVHSCHADFKLLFILPTSIKNTHDLNCYAASYTEKPHQQSDNEVTEEWTSKPDVPTSKRMLVLLLRNKPKTFPSSETGCLSEPWWTELYNWAWGHSSTSCHPALTLRLPMGRTTLALGTVRGFFMCLI